MGMRALIGGASAALLLYLPATAQVFDAGLPAGWVCTGNCGTAAADGVVGLAPGGGTRYGWVSNADGAVGVLLPGVSVPANSADGSTLRSHLFTAAAGQDLAFALDFVTTDGSDFLDYGWARLLHADGSAAALLVTARVSPDGDAMPGYEMPSMQAEIDPPFAGLGGPTLWSPLGADSGSCYARPCGQSDWVAARYTIAAAGQYYLEFGVVNWADRNAASGLAFDRITLDGMPLAPVPEPATWPMLLAGLGVFGAWLRARDASGKARSHPFLEG